MVVETLAGSPAAGVLHSGDMLEAVDGRPLHPSNAAGYLSSLAPGRAVSFQVERPQALTREELMLMAKSWSKSDHLI